MTVSLNSASNAFSPYSVGKKPSNEYIEPDLEKDASMSHRHGKKNTNATTMRIQYVMSTLSTFLVFAFATFAFAVLI